MTRRFLLAAAFAVTWLGSAAMAQLPPEMSDLVKMKSKNLDAVYILPGADFKAYKKVMIDSTQVSFAKNWLKDMNSRGAGNPKIRPEDVKEVADEARKGFGDIIAAAFKDAGFEVVTDSGPEVLRLTPAVINIYVNAPMTNSTATRTYVMSAGQASFVLAARDSISGALIGMALDSQETRRAMAGPVMTNGVVNRAEFEVMFKRWAQVAVKGLKGLQEAPPVPEKKK